VLHLHRAHWSRQNLAAIRLALALCLSFSALAHASDLLIFDDSTQGILACGHIASGGTTGWDDGTVYLGDIAGTRFHLLVVIRDTATLQSYFAAAALDSAKLALTLVSKFGAPGDLDLYYIHRDSTGQGVYPAYNDNLLSYCRSTWIKRKGADPSVCPDSILWQTPGALGPIDRDTIPFASLPSPSAAGTAYEIDVTSWTEGVINRIDSRSNGIMLLASAGDGAGSDFISIRNIHPFYSGDSRLQLKVWYHPIDSAPPRRAWLDAPDDLK
jgi:hypothetical protein